MKVLHINCNYLGTTLHQKMVESLSGRGIESKVFVPVHGAENLSITPAEYVVVSKCFRKKDRLFFDYKQQKIYKSIDKNIDIKVYDCIHAYTLFTDGNTAMRLSKKYGIPYIVAVRNTDVNSFFKLMPHLRGRGIKIMRNAEKIIFLSESYRKRVFEKYVPQKYYKELFSKTCIIPNGIDDFWYKNHPDTLKDKNIEVEKSIKLVYAGRIDKNKNVPTTQKAMQVLRERGYKCELTVVGRVQDKQVFEKIMSDESTRYITEKPKEEIIDIYRENDIFVMPSFSESFGLVYAEAMSQGIPVIYTQNEGFDGQFPDGEVGYAVNPYDPCDVAGKIEMLVKNYNIVAGKVCQNSMRFSWDKISGVYTQIYDDVRRKYDESCS